MSSKELESWLQRQVAHDSGAVVWLRTHLTRTALFERRHVASTTFAGTLQTRRWQHDLRWFTTSQRIAGNHLAKLRAEIRAAEERAALPAHYALWRCIAGYPGARTDGRNGESGGSPAASNGSHFNILQMTDPWGSRSIDPIGMSPAAIMQQAESEYARTGYSSSWLWGQWAATLGDCVQFA